MGRYLAFGILPPREAGLPVSDHLLRDHHLVVLALGEVAE